MSYTHIKKLQPLSGLVGIVILWVGVGLAMHKAKLGFIDVRPISYLGIDSRTSQLFSFSLLISAALFICFGFYVRQAFKVTNKFLIFLIIGQAGQMIAAVTPYGHMEPMRTVHTYAAFTLAFSLPFLIAAFRNSQKNSKYQPLYTNLFRFELITFVVGIGLFIFTKGIAPISETLPALGFHIWIITVTYIHLKSAELHKKTIS